MSVEPQDRLLFYRGAAEFWHSAILLQSERCTRSDLTSSLRRADLGFFIVAVQRLREVVRMVRDRGGIPAAGETLREFDDAWPRLKELRNIEEHILGPSGRSPLGIWYFGDFAADLKARGEVEYIVHADRMLPAVNRLFDGICALLPDVPEEIERE